MRCSYSASTRSNEYRLGGILRLPAQIPLDRIDTIEAKPSGFVSKMKLFSNTSNSRTMLLHLEYRDDRGRPHGYDFIPADAQQSNNDWAGGDSEAMRNFATIVKYASTLRAQQLNAPPDSNTATEATPAKNPITGEEIKPPAIAGGATSTESVPGAPAFYKAQVCWQTACNAVTVWPVSPADPSRLRVVDDATQNLLVDIPRMEISKVTVRQKAVELRTPTPNQLTVTIPMPFSPPQAPKVYQLCLRVPYRNGKQISQCFISDLAACRLDVPCQEGSDGGRDVLELESSIKGAKR